MDDRSPKGGASDWPETVLIDEERTSKTADTANEKDFTLIDIKLLGQFL
jgi:hypothetical protein